MALESWTVSGPQTVDVARATSLDVELSGGRVDVVAHDDPGRADVRVEVHAVAGRPLRVRSDGSSVRVGYDAPGGGWQGLLERLRTWTGRDRAEVHVAVPATAHVSVATVHGEGLVAGVRAGARVRTVSGSLLTSATRGALHVATVSGDVSVSEHDGPLSLESVSGELTATGALHGVTLSSVSGDATVDTRATPSEVRVKAVSAEVLLRLPDPDAMDYEVRCVSGRLVVDGVQQRGEAGTFTRPSPSGVGHPVRVSAVSGDVTVLRGGVEDAVPDDGPDLPVWGTPSVPAPVPGGPADA